jgi:hypothetical protein
MSYSVATRDSTSLVDASSNFDYAPLGTAYRTTKEQIVYASGMTPTVMSTLALRFPQGLERNTWDITKPYRNVDNTYKATIDMMSPVDLAGELNPVGYPTLATAYKM